MVKGLGWQGFIKMACDGCKKLNLRSGNRPQSGGFVNHDFTVHRSEVDIVHDLNKLPWPWEDNSWDLVRAFHTFGYLELDLIVSLNECWRIVKPKGILNVKYPVVGKSSAIYDDPTRRWFWSEESLDFVDPRTDYGQRCGYYTDRKWKIRTKKLCSKGKNCIAILTPMGK